MEARGFRFGGAAWSRFALVFVLAVQGAGCGGDEGKPERVASMIAPVEGATAGAESEGPPAVESVVIDPARAVPGTRIRAKARMRSTGGRRVAVDYQWQTASGRALGQGQELDTAGLEPDSVVEVVATPSVEGEAGEPFVRRFRLSAEASQLALVVIDVPEGKRVGSVLRAVVETSDDEAGFDEVALEWRVAGKIVGTEEELDTSPFQPGDVVELRASAAGALEEGSSRARRVHAEPIVLEASAAPEITSQPSSGVDGGVFRYAVQASSAARGAVLRYELLKGPEGMTVDAASGVVEWRPKQEQRGRFEIEVAVMDQWGSGVAQRFELNADPSTAPPAAAR